MTEPTPTPRRAPIRKPGPLPVIAGSLGLFLAITALLALQLRAGADPALGAGEPQVVAAASPAPRKVLIRRVIVTRIVEHRRDDGGSAPRRARTAHDDRRARSAPPPRRPLRPRAPAPLTTRSS